MPIVLQERDLEMLKKLNKYGALHSQDVSEIYKSQFAEEGSKNTYRYRRLRSLEKEGYIGKRERIYYLCNAGRDLLKEVGEVEGYKRVRAEKRRVLADIYSIAKEINGFEGIVTRSDLNSEDDDGESKSEYLVRYLFKLVSKDNGEYYLYKIKGITPLYAIKAIVSDMQRLGNVNVIILYEGVEAREKYVRLSTGRMAKEILIPLCEKGLRALNMLGMGYLNDEVVYGELKKAGIHVEIQGNRFLVNGAMSYNITDCNYLTERTMDTFMKTFNPNDMYYIICTDFMRDYFARKYPNAKVLPLEV